MVSETQSAGGDIVPGSTGQSGFSAAERQTGSRPSRADALPIRSGEMPLRELIELYMAKYAGRDGSRVQRLAWWASEIGDIPLQDLTDDHVHASIEKLSRKPARFYLGKDAEGASIYKSKGKPLSPATLNRYAAALGAVITWAMKRRIAPRGYVHPCRTVERHTENNEKTRFLSEGERLRLLDACRASSWPRLYALVLMALTTGARKGELTALKWRDVDLEHAVAYCGRTKNGDPKVLPLTPALVDTLRLLEGGQSHSYIFSASTAATKPYSFENRWRAALNEAKVRNFRFHDLRHTCASMLAQSGATLLEIGDLLGHRQLQVTKRYSHLTTGHKAALVKRVLGSLG